MPSLLNPGGINWKYFYLEEGEVVSSEEVPEGRKPVAMLNTSTFFCQNKCDTPALMKKNIARILQHDLEDDGVKRKPNICVAVPCEDFETMEKYYGKEVLKKHYGESYEEEKDYITLRMHDDLAQGNKKFFPHEARFEGTMPAKEGAEQLVSAIENGFDIWSYGGGNSVTPKLKLCEEYFSQNYQTLREQGKLQEKVRFVGFSNGTTMAFYLRGLVDYSLDFGVNWAFNSRDSALEKADEELLNFRNRQIDNLLRSFEKEGDVEVVRKLSGDEENFRKAKARYDEAAGKKITNLTCYAGQLVPVAVDGLIKFGAEEKIILGLESFQKKSSGFEPDQALSRFLESGCVDPRNILFIALEDFIDSSEMFEIPRNNGIIPNYAELRLEEQFKIRELAKSDDVEVCQKYISESNLRSQKAIASMMEVANRYEIPVINGGERRVGHGKYCQLVPSYVSGLQFHDEDLSIEQTSVLTAHPEIQEDLIFSSKASTRAEPKSTINTVKFEDLSQEIESIKLIPLTGSAEFLTKAPEEIIVGRPLDLCDLAAESMVGKGVAVYLPMEPGLVLN